MNSPIHIILFEPEIPPNTGNLIRLCANAGLMLHLVEPLGFSLDTKAVRRAGLDYHDMACVQVHASIDHALTYIAELKSSSTAESAHNTSQPESAEQPALKDLPDTGENNSSTGHYPPRLYAITTKGSVVHTEPEFHPGDQLLFGPESRGLPDWLLNDPRVSDRLRIPMLPDSRSLNLANAVSIISYEALRQLGFPALS